MSRLHRPARHPRGPRRALIVASMTLALLAAATPARAQFTIVPTFGSSITSDPNAAAIEGAINAAITAVETPFSNPVTVKIYFQEGGGLGQSDTSIFGSSYFNYYNAIKANASSSSQLTALASLGAAPGPGTGNPVTGNNSGVSIVLTSANGRALGFNTPGGVAAAGGLYDSVISLNTSITAPPNPLNGGTYGLQAVAAHEIDEVLGVGGPGTTLGSGFDTQGFIGEEDLYRYSAPGVRSFSTVQTTSPFSYYSIDGGKTVMSYFNQTAGADYADWLSNPIPAGFGPQVQDAFGQPNTNPALGPNELTALNVAGWDLKAVPEPSSVVLLGIGTAAFAGLGRRLRRARATT
jgi:hypothetical protein